MKKLLKSSINLEMLHIVIKVYKKLFAVNFLHEIKVFNRDFNSVNVLGNTLG